MIIKTCPICNKDFITYPSINNITCSFKCAGLRKSQLYWNINKRSCKICKIDFVPKHSKTPGIYCSYKCSAFNRMKKIIIRSGYVYIHLPNHPLASKQGYYAKHRYIIEQHIGRILDKKEVVHHVNHNRSDNRISNLKLYASAGQHAINEHIKNVNGRFV